MIISFFQQKIKQKLYLAVAVASVYQTGGWENSFDLQFFGDANFSQQLDACEFRLLNLTRRLGDLLIDDHFCIPNPFLTRGVRLLRFCNKALPTHFFANFLISFVNS